MGDKKRVVVTGEVVDGVRLIREKATYGVDGFRLDPGMRPTRVKMQRDRGGNVTVEFWLDRDDWSSEDRNRINEIQASGKFDVGFRFAGRDKVFTVFIEFEQLVGMKWSEGVLAQLRGV